MQIEIGRLLLDLIIILVAGKIGGEIFEEMGQTSVLGELIVGIILGTSFLGIIRESEIVSAFAEIGLIILLFEVGLKSNVDKILRVGKTSSIVAFIGMVVPFFLGYEISQMMGMGKTVSIFIGAALTPTSIGITARVLEDLNKLDSEESRIILGAAILDDIGGLLILSVITAKAVTALEIAKTSIFAILFLVLAIGVGIKAAPILFNVIEKMKVRGSEIVGAFVFALLLAYLASLIGLATIVGAFSAGLILARSEHQRHIERKIKSVSDIFVPIFFVLIGASVNIKTLINFDALFFVIVLMIIATVGKLASGLLVRKKINKAAIGVGMMPRGEVALIFVGIGSTISLIDESTLSIIATIAILTTLITPPLLKKVFK